MALSFSKWWHLRIDRWFPESWTYTYLINRNHWKAKQKQTVTMPKFVFHYFDARGRGEPARLLFAVAGIPFQDRRVSQEEWPTLKPSRSGCFDYRLFLLIWRTFVSPTNVISFRDSWGHTAVLRSWRGRIHTEFSYFSTSCQIIW